MERPNVKLVQKNWKFIDDHVKKISENDGRSFESLLAFLDQPVRKRLDRNIYMTRAIIYWMYQCGFRKQWPGDLPPESPLALMKQIKERKLSRHDAFVKLCTKAGIECKRVTGIAKLVGFEPGQRDFEKFRVTWNKVKLEGFWWPVFPDWIMQSVAKDKHSVIQTFTDFFFLTDPELFIYKCYPDNTEDQMLPVSKQIKTSRKFAKLPHLGYHFFRHNLTLTSEHSSVLDAANDGKCVVSFKSDSAPARSLNFHPKLILPNQDGQEKVYDPNRLVFNSRRKGQFIFEVRCPILGMYRLEIRGGPVEEDPKLYLTANIECLETSDEVNELPIDAGAAAWGFGPLAESAGLSKPTIKDPKMVVTLSSNAPESNTVKVGFCLERQKSASKSFDAQLVTRGLREDDLADDIELKTSHDRLEVTAHFRNPGEYALSILASDDSDTTGTPTRVCNYLISTLEDPETVAEEYEDSSDGFSDIDEENFALERELAELEAKYNDLVHRPSSALSLFPPRN